MPSTATITAFYNFTANTKARASQVNTNFDVFRGHLLPVSPSTSTAIGNTYDLGSNEYYWRNLYLKEINLGATSSSWKIADATTTSGDLIFYKNNSEISRFTTSYGFTSSAAVSQFARSAGTSGTFSLDTAGSASVSGSTLTITTVGRPVEVFIKTYSVTIGSATFYAKSRLTNSAGGVIANIGLYRNTSTSLVASYLSGIAVSLNATTTLDNLQYELTIALEGIRFTDIDPPAGTHTYFFKPIGLASLTAYSVSNFIVYAKEMS